MAAEPIPSKTSSGQLELAKRVLGLGQRHRTILLLVDGHRSLSQVLRMGESVGVQRAVFDDLVARGLVELPAAAPPAAPARPVATDSRGGPATDIELPLDAGVGDSTLLPAARSLLPESAWNPLDSVPPLRGLSRPLEEARQLLIKAVRREAPVSGALTLVKLKMANSREDLVALLDEVEQRLNKPRRMIISAQTMRHVRHLLTMAESMASMPGA